MENNDMALPASQDRAVVNGAASVSAHSGDGQAYGRSPRWRADCPKCVASKFTCDEHYLAGGTA